MAFESATSESPGLLLEMSLLRPHSGPAESETLEGEPRISVLLSPPGDSEVHQRWRMADLNYRI